MSAPPRLPLLASRVGVSLARETGIVVLLALALTLAAAAPATVPALGLNLAHAAKAKGKKGKARCPKGKVRLGVKGKVRCVKPKAVKPIADKKSPAMRNAELLVGPKMPPIKLVRKGKSYGTFRGPLSKAAEKRLLKEIAATEKKLKAAALARVRQLPSTGAGAVAGISRASASAGGGAPEIEFGRFEVKFDQQTGDYEFGGNARTDVKLDNGAQAGVEVSVEVKGNTQSSAEPDLEVGVSVETTKGTEVTGRGFTIKVPLNKQNAGQTCPTADGSVKHDTTSYGSSTSLTADRVGKLEIDSVSTKMSVGGGLKSEYTMTDDARLPARIPFKTNTTISYTAVARVLGLKVHTRNVTAKGTASGAVDSKTGEVAPGANIDVKVEARGVSYMETSMTSTALSVMRRAIGELLADAKKIEKNAVEGNCTKIVFNPKSFAVELGNGETENVEAKLESTEKGGKSVSGPVRMLAVAHAGKVSHDEAARTNPANMNVTAGEEEPSPAEVRVSLISRAGISRATWNAKPRRFPKRYSGPVSYEYVYAPTPGYTETLSGKATVTYELKESQSRPDGSVHGRYDAIGANLTEIGHEQVTGEDGAGCRLALKPNPRPPASQEIAYAELEILISPTGQWSSGVVLDIDPGEMPAEMTCDGVPPTSALLSPNFVFNSYRPSVPGLRPMDKAGPIEGSGVTDVLVTAQPGMSATADWSLQPQN